MRHFIALLVVTAILICAPNTTLAEEMRTVFPNAYLEVEQGETESDVNNYEEVDSYSAVIDGCDEEKEAMQEEWLFPNETEDMEATPIGIPTINMYYCLPNAVDYTDLGNSMSFSVQGKSISGSQIASTGNCWSWANSMYKKIWENDGFTSDFIGTPSSGYNLLRNLGDNDRLLTVSHLKEYIGAADLGACIRITACTSSCSNFTHDGCKLHNYGHNLILVSKDSDGFAVIDDHLHDNKRGVYTFYYTWEGFVKYWKNYPYIKYIKWPNAPEYGKSGSPISPSPTNPDEKNTGVTLSYENTNYTVAKDFNLKRKPYSDSEPMGTYGVGDVLQVKRVVLNDYNNVWLEVNTGGYIYGGYKYENGTFTQTGTQYLSLKSNNPQISVNNPNMPSGTLTQGKGFEIKGTIDSSNSIHSVNSEIFSGSTRVASSNTWHSSDRVTRSLDLSSSVVNTTLKFGPLPAGSYTFKLNVTYYYDRGTKTATKTVCSTSFNIGNGELSFDRDTVLPTISNIQVSNISSEGYTVTCTVSDNVGVTEVKFPTWTEKNGQDDLIWHVGTLSGTKASYNVKARDHNGETGCRYITHIYAYDAAGNSSSADAGTINVPSSTIMPTGVSLSSTSLSLKVGDTYTLTATVSPQNASNKSVSWSSNNSSVVTIVDGKVTAKGEGTATITATTVNGKTATCSCVVTNPVPTLTIKKNAKATLYVGDKDVQIIAEGSTIKTCKSTKTSVAKVSKSGIITAKKAGTAKIKITLSNKKRLTLTLTIKDPKAPSNITFKQGKEGVLEVSEDMQLDVEPVWPRPDLYSAKTAEVSFKSSDTKIATVSGKGFVEAKKTGTVKITATSKKNKKATCTYTLNVVKAGSTKYTVSFNANGGMCSTPSITVKKGTTIDPLPVPTREYYEFVGWFTAASGGTQVGTGTIISANMTVYAHWREKGWSNWMEASSLPSGDLQTQSKTQYRYQDARYSDWSSWSGWSENRESTNDLKKEDTTTLYYWYRFVCPHCGAHMHVWDKCHTWAGGCGNKIGSDNCQVTWLPLAPGEGVQNWEGTGRIMTGSSSKDRWFYWTDASQGYPNGKSTTGYRYATRTLSWGDWSGWSDNTVTGSDKRRVETRTMYRYKIK